MPIQRAKPRLVDLDQTPLTSFSGLASSDLPAGAVLQVVQQVFQTFTQLNSTSSLVDTGITQAITPSSTSNKILVRVSLQLSTNTTSAQYLRAALLADSTVIRRYDNIHSANGTSDDAQPSFEFLHSPSTTSAITYKVQMRNTNSSIFRINNWGGSDGEACSTITLLEIKG